MYVVGSALDAVYQYSLSTPYSLASGVTYDNISLALATLETVPSDISFNSTGTVLWIAGNINDRIYEFRLGTAWDISTAVFYDDVFVGFNEVTLTGLHVIPEQNVAYIVGSNTDTVYQYSTNTPAIVIASSGISSVSSIVLNNETRVKDKLYVKGLAHFDSNIVTQGNAQVDGNLTVSGGTITAGNVAMNLLAGNSTTNITFASGQTSGTLAIGGGAHTGAITLGQATVSQTLNLATGVSAASTTKTINLGTGGASGSFTNINIGPTAGVGTITINSATTLIVGTQPSTGTGNQRLQVTSGAYIGGNLGIGTTNPTVNLQLSPTAAISNVGFGITLAGTVGSALTVAQFLYTNANTSYLRIKATRNAVGSDWLSASTKLVNVTDVSEQGYIEYNPDGSLNGMAFGRAAIEWARFLQNGNLGIGRTNPSNKLEVLGSIAAYSGDTTSVATLAISGAGVCDITAFKSTGASLRFVTANSSGTNTDRGRVDSSGNFIIGAATSTGTASQRLQVNSGGYFNGLVGIGTTNPTSELTVQGNVYITGVATATDFNSLSDISLKTNVTTIADPLEKVMQIRGVTFDWKENQRASAGVIAQEIEKVLPQLVNGGEIKTVNYNGLIGLLIECVKKQQEEIDELKKKSSSFLDK
jgi:hypothetical protein